MQCPCDTAPLPVMAFRRCAGNFVGVVDWAEPDDSQCSFSDMTRQLCALPNVSNVFQLRLACREPFSSSALVQVKGKHGTIAHTNKSQECAYLYSYQLSVFPCDC